MFRLLRRLQQKIQIKRNAEAIASAFALFGKGDVTKRWELPNFLKKARKMLDLLDFL